MLHKTWKAFSFVFGSILSNYLSNRTSSHLGNRTNYSLAYFLPYTKQDWFCSVQIQNQELPSKYLCGIIGNCVFRRPRIHFSAWLPWGVTSRLHHATIDWPVLVSLPF